jgi:hypothetical protein
MSSFDESDAFEGASLAARAMAARPMPYLDDLNPEQRAAVEALDGPVLMLAGAGTGKTKALTTRLVHLLNTGAARPNEQGRPRDEVPRGAASGRTGRGDAVAGHLPFHLRQASAPPCRACRPEIELHDP